MKKLLTSAVFIALTVVSGVAQNDRLGATQWKLVRLAGTPVTTASKAYLELNAEQTRFSGNAGCNRMFGAVTVQGRRIDFSNVGTTRMACADPRVRNVETAFVRALENVDRFRRSRGSLELYDRNRLVAQLTASVNQPPSGGGQNVGLEDRKWMLDSIKGTPVATAGRSAFLVFDRTKGSAGGNSSCNVFGGNYTSTGSTLKIVDVISTMRACIEDDRMTIEREFLEGLRQANRYEIKRGSLVLYRNDRLLLSFNGEAK